jgi:hypothetical protein
MDKATRGLVIGVFGALVACSGNGDGMAGPDKNGNGASRAAPADSSNPGSSTSGGSNSGAVTSGGTTGTPTPPPPPDDPHGVPSTTYPAFLPDVAQIKNNGGPVLKAPLVVTITYPGETRAADFESFGDTLGATQFWAAVTSEYGVGPLTSGPGNHVRMRRSLPATMTADALQQMIATNAENG